MKKLLGISLVTLALILALFSAAPAQSTSTKSPAQEKYLLKLAAWFPGSGHT